MDSQKIKRVFEVSGGENTINIMKDNILNAFKHEELDKHDEKIMEKFFSKLTFEGLCEKIIPIYEELLSESFVDAVIKFYESPEGKKYVEVLPELTKRTMETCEEWGTELMKEAEEEVETNG